MVVKLIPNVLRVIYLVRREVSLPGNHVMNLHFKGVISACILAMDS